MGTDVHSAHHPGGTTDGLYGSRSTSANMGIASVAEFVGTFILVLVGTAAAVASVLALPIGGGDIYDSIAIAFAHGVALVAVVSTIGHVSGAHVNPAVTLSLAVTGNLPWKYVPGYVVAQLGGAVTAALTVWALYGDAARDRAALGATLPGDGVGIGQALLAEAVITFVLVLTVMAVATDDRVPPATAGLAVGLALTAGIIVAGPLTGGAANPARALGPMLVAGQFSGWWQYIVGPVIGGVLAGLLYRYVVGRAQAPE